MNTQDTIHHPLFARFYARFVAAKEGPEIVEHRRRLLQGLSGRVLEVGAGTGVNFRFYPNAVAEVVALEPEPYLRDHAAEAVAEAPIPVTVQAGTADRLQLPDDSFDAVVCSLVLCSVQAQADALAEIRRVLRPGGELRFYEHVVANRQPMADVQRALQATVWPRLFGNCHPARDTAAEIQRAGFAMDDCDGFPYRPTRVQPRVPFILGRAHVPPES